MCMIVGNDRFIAVTIFMVKCSNNYLNTLLRVLLLIC